MLVGYLVVVAWGMGMTAMGWRLARSERYRRRSAEASFAWRKWRRRPPTEDEIKSVMIMNQIAGYGFLLIVGPAGFVAGLVSVICYLGWGIRVLR
jgi:hypothetical protein